MSIETGEISQGKAPRWTTHPRRLPENKDYKGRPVIENGSLVFQSQPGEVITREGTRDGVDIYIDVTGGRRQNMHLYHLREEAAGLSLLTARALNWFDQTRFGRWWNAEPRIN